MEGECDAPPVGMTVVAVAALLPLEGEAIGLQRGKNSAGTNGAELGVVNRHTVTATTGWSETVTLGGNASPSSKRLSITSWATS